MRGGMKADRRGQVEPALSVVIPASNEARLLPACLRALLCSDAPPLDVVVVSNGSRDGTAEVALDFVDLASTRGWRLHVLDLPEGGKPGALNAGDAAALAPARAYLDADVTVAPDLMAKLLRALDREEPAYASGRVAITAEGAFSRAYARAWSRVPFMSEGVPGCGLFAVNAAGRARWGLWPALISDDTFARLHFAPHERHLVDSCYRWPVAEGLRALLRVRRRQDRGVAEIRARRPDLLANEGERLTGGGLLSTALRDPLAALAYAGVAAAVRLRPGDGAWSRGR
jgi:glycosyltransferase involved in cell wall biosynthesis